MILGVDAKALEWVCVNFLSQDAVGCAEINEGIDQHSANQKAFSLPSRLIAKKFVFRLIYGGTAFSYSVDPDFTSTSSSLKYWDNVIKEFYRKYKGIERLYASWMNTVIRERVLVMPTGREYEYYPERLPSGEIKWPRTIILNYPVQGLGADLMAIIRVILRRRIRHLPVKLLSTIHDSIFIDMEDKYLDEVAVHIQAAFSEAPAAFYKAFGVKFNLPLRCELKVGPYMGDMKEWLKN